MNLEYSADELAFRDEVRAFLDAHLTEDMRAGQRTTTTVITEPEVNLPWHRILFRQGWVAPAWPREYGGTGWTPTQRYIFENESAIAGAPVLSPSGLKMVGPVLMGFGSEEQKRFYLPRILSGEDTWCQGYSEPGAGSDLASLKTRAVRSGDHYIVNGTKIWTTLAHKANRMFALVRTDDAGRKQEGISFLLIDMDTPGITVRPIQTIGGDHEVNQVFFDDVRVPQSHRVGAEGEGWRTGKYLLEFERGGGPAASKILYALRQIVREAREAHGGEALQDPAIAAAITEASIDIEALNMTELRLMTALQAGQNPGPMSSLLKLRVSQLHQQVARIGVMVLGDDALPWEAQRPLHPLDHEPATNLAVVPLVSRYLNTRAYTIFGGSAEIQHEIIARAVCGA
ncbi:acyl-CoA dehydrogenase family protein [Hydrogenophaga sp. BPS33]|uniref:acyl-CoA dehydrogenase family protein n=1 Tax=Hydrogenophaga sp. BPS33 TaxID=2651974 RepID=UPI0013200EEA|nr:acyl-CoA dehydrogenase family protein [Hydrogenophaga sp. BPS33]QHE87522.1 acyl-CoA dehydrogenase [Hydrogenophaga sp. BPS33]